MLFDSSTIYHFIQNMPSVLKCWDNPPKPNIILHRHPVLDIRPLPWLPAQIIRDAHSAQTNTRTLIPPAQTKITPGPLWHT